MYSFTGRVRYSETDSSGALSLTGLINYFQDCATLHSEDVGLGVEELMRLRTVWVLSAWQAVLWRMPRLGEEVRVVTNPYRIKGFSGHRDFVLETPAGERLAAANSVWSIIDPETGRLARISDELAARYGAGTPLDVDWGERHIRQQGTGEKLPPLTVPPHALDTNGHMNNSRYVTLASDCAGIRTCSRLRVEYKRPARLGAAITPVLFRAEESVTVSLENEEGEPYAIVEFR